MASGVGVSVENEGKLDDVSLAMHIFSDNWEHEDTKILYDSDAYLKQHLAVFSSQYVIDAVHNGIDHVLLSKYFLIPPCITNNIKMRGFQTTSEVGHKNKIDCPLSKHSQAASSPETRSSNVQKDDSPHNLSSSHLSSASSSTDVSSPEKSSSLMHHEKNHDIRNVSTNEVTTKKVVKTAPVTSVFKHGNRHREMERVDTDAIPHIKSLPKVISCLRTIYPGKDGVEVKYVT